MNKNNFLKTILVAGLTCGILNCNDKSKKYERYESYFPKDAKESKYFPKDNYNQILNGQSIRTKELETSSNIYYALEYGLDNKDTAVYINIISKSTAPQLDNIVDVVLIKGHTMNQFQKYQYPAKNALDSGLITISQSTYNGIKLELENLNK